MTNRIVGKERRELDSGASPRPADERSIAVVTVNYRTPELVVELIESLLLEKETFPRMILYVVDNDSGDGSLGRIDAYVAEKGLSWVRTMEAPGNDGFAAGNNFALEAIAGSGDPPDCIWLLNPDTRVISGAAKALVDFLESGKADVVGSRLEDANGVPAVSAFNFPSPWSELSSGARLGVLDRAMKSRLVRREIAIRPEPCDWVSGASLMLRYEVFAEIGPMDSGFFLYFEEIDYCLAARRAGFRCWYVPEGRVYHAECAATASDGMAGTQKRRPAYWFESRRRFFLKNFGPLVLAAADSAFILGYLSWLLRKAIAGKRPRRDAPPRYLRDFVRHSFLGKGFRLDSGAS